jgi:hypothetical protein
MLEMSVSMHGLTTLEKDISEIRGELPETGRKIMDDLASRVAVEARSRVGPRGSGSGALKNSIRAQWLNQYALKLSAGQGLSRPYAYYQEMGFTPHYVHRSQWMGPRWTSSDEFAYVSKHTPYMRPALALWTQPKKIDEIILEHMKGIKVLGGR